ncbi:hypothetical protein [Cellulomonas aerilata]|uniref:Integral membrane protein n=1 Tax=Cellulomonas aerilata TaxID=515326 RepID=A0A512DE24_9CELL|nr:hypothetical protein [Cellulomonas aerilata]GEO34718.1 hypothetical protein CAE01nite_24430 [Cellulomonas aerilata]
MLAVWAVARAWSAVVLLVVAREQVEVLWVPQDPSYVQYTGLMWDADWYRGIATEGYPDSLPTGPDGRVLQNPWAFYPLYPLLTRGVMALTGASWALAAPTLALVLGAGAALCVHAVVRRGAPRAVAAVPGLPLATVALVGCFPAGPVLQVAYTESLALLLVAGSLLLLLQRRYGWAAVTVVALGFTRAVALPMAVVVLVHAAVRLRAARHAARHATRDGGRGPDRLGPRDGAGLLALLAAAVVSGVAWPLICGWATGVPDGYLRTQAAWRGRPEVVPMVPWLDVARWLWGPAGPWLLVPAGALVVAVLLSPPARRLGAELQAWTAAYLAYLVGVVEPGTSLVRFSLLAFPLGAVAAGAVRGPAWARRLWLGALLVAGAALQLAWTWGLWRLTPPSGWPP